MRWGTVLIVLGALLLAAPAAADWPSQGRFVAPGGMFQTRGAWMYDLPSGDLLVRTAGYETFSSSGIGVQSVTPAGEIAPGWPAYGVGLGAFSSEQPLLSVGFAVDPNGFSWGGSQEPYATAYAVSPTGVQATFSLPFGLSQSAFAPAPRGIYASVGDRVQRFTEAGIVAPGWPANGVSYAGTYGQVALPDGSGGVVVMAFEGTPVPGPLVLRVDSSGVKHAGRRLSLDDADAHPEDPSLVAPLPALLPSDSSHYFAVWSARTDSVDDHVKVQRVGYNSALAPGWPTDGLVAVASHTIFHVTPLSDHAGGLFLVWYQDDGLPRATHMRADGTFVPGTDANGVVLFPPGPLREPQEGFDGGILPYMVADVTPDGRLIFAWDDVTSGNGIRVQWLLPDLTADPTEPVEGRLIMPNPGKTWVSAVHAAPDGGAYVAWNSASGPPNAYGNTGELWMTRILPSSLVGVAPLAMSLALSAPRPNPARGAVAFDVTLPDDSPARVELLDITGRVVRSQLVQGAGRHAVSFADLASVAPGLYFARVHGMSGNVATRVVVSR